MVTLEEVGNGDVIESIFVPLFPLRRLLLCFFFAFAVLVLVLVVAVADIYKYSNCMALLFRSIRFSLADL